MSPPEASWEAPAAAPADDPVPDGPTAEEAEDVFRAFVRIMDQAANDPVIGHRLALGDVVVHVELVDSPQNFVMTLMLDRKPIEAVDHAVGTPEVVLGIKTADVFRFWAGDFHLAMGIARGEVTFTGPVRKLLRVVPIARRLVTDFRQMAEEHDVRIPAAERPDGDDGEGPST